MTKLVGTATLSSSAGVQGVYLGNNLTSAEVIASERLSGDAWSHKSHGYWVDGWNDYCVSTMADGTNGKSVLSTGKIIRHYEKISSAWTVVFEAEIDSVGGGYLYFNVTVATKAGNYPILIYGEY